MEYDGTWESLCVPLLRGTFRVCVYKQPGSVGGDASHPGVKKQASKEVDIDKLKKQGDVEDTKAVGQPHSTLSVGKPRTSSRGKGVALLCKDLGRHHPLTQIRR